MCDLPHRYCSTAGYQNISSFLPFWYCVKHIVAFHTLYIFLLYFNNFNKSIRFQTYFYIRWKSIEKKSILQHIWKSIVLICLLFQTSSHHIHHNIFNKIHKYDIQKKMYLATYIIILWRNIYSLFIHFI